MSQLDSGQVIKSVFDADNQALKVTSVGAEYQVDLRASDGDSVISIMTNSYSNITSNTTTLVKSGAGVLRSIIINTAGSSSNVATLYDNTAGSGTKIATIDTTARGVLTYDIAFSTGLTIVTATGSAADITVSYS